MVTVVPDIVDGEDTINRCRDVNTDAIDVNTIYVTVCKSSDDENDCDFPEDAEFPFVLLLNTREPYYAVGR